MKLPKNNQLSKISLDCKMKLHSQFECCKLFGQGHIPFLQLQAFWCWFIELLLHKSSKTFTQDLCNHQYITKRYPKKVIHLRFWKIQQFQRCFFPKGFILQFYFLPYTLLGKTQLKEELPVKSVNIKPKEKSGQLLIFIIFLFIITIIDQ